jgi:pyruvate,orthophosphate dikinase
LSSVRAEKDADVGPVILVRETASPDDIAGIDRSAGILTARGARTSHAAVVARQLGKVCVVNCTALSIDPVRHRCSIGTVTLREGDFISIDGNTGAVYRGRVRILSKRPDELIAKIRQWQIMTA